MHKLSGGGFLRPSAIAPHSNVPLTERHTNHPRSSTVGGQPHPSLPSSVGKKEDPRPLKEPAFRKQQSQRLLEFIKTNRELCPNTDFNPLDLKALYSCPSISGTRNLFGLLLMVVFGESSPSILLLNGAQDILNADWFTMILRTMLKYPFNIPISRGQVNVSILTWPALLGVALWLLDHIEAKSRKNAEHPGGMDTVRGFFRHASEMRQRPTDEIASEHERLQATIADKILAVETQTNARMREFEQITHRIQVIENAPDHPERLTALRNQHQHDLDVFQRFLTGTTTHVKAKQEELQALRQNRENLGQTEQQLRTELSEVSALLAAQPISRMDENRLVRETQQFNAQIAEQTQKMEEINRAKEKCEQQLRSELDRLGNGCAELNQLAVLMKISPGAKHGPSLPAVGLTQPRPSQLYPVQAPTPLVSLNPQAVRGFLSLHENNGDAMLEDHCSEEGDEPDGLENLFSVDLKTSILPLVQRLGDHYTSKLAHLRTALAELTDRICKETDIRNLNSAELSQLRSRVGQLETALERVCSLQAEQAHAEKELALKQTEFSAQELRLCQMTDTSLRRLLELKTTIEATAESTSQQLRSLVR